MFSAEENTHRRRYLNCSLIHIVTYCSACLASALDNPRREYPIFNIDIKLRSISEVDNSDSLLLVLPPRKANIFTVNN